QYSSHRFGAPPAPSPASPPIEGGVPALPDEAPVLGLPLAPPAVMPLVPPVLVLVLPARGVSAGSTWAGSMSRMFWQPSSVATATQRPPLARTCLTIRTPSVAPA